MSMTTTPSVQSWTRRPTTKLAAIGALLILLLLPSMWVDGVVREREERQDAVRKEVGRGWGPAQSVLGPILVVPYRVPDTAAVWSGGQLIPAVTGRHYAYITPYRLLVDAKLSPEQRRRGLFAALVYGAGVNLTGTFSVPDLSISAPPNAEILWAESFVVAGASDWRASSTAPLRWNESELQPGDNPPMGTDCGSVAFQSWSLSTAPLPGQTIAFSTRMDLRGTGGFHVVPSAQHLTLDVSAPWTTPSFTGAILPTDSTVTNEAFTARWQDGAHPAVWFGSAPMTCAGPAAAAANVEQQDGVDLLEALPTYRMVNRTAKYVLLFLALSFLTYFLFETLSGTPIHLVQYGLIGLAICLFPLLLLAFSEPLGFATAYLITSGGVVVQASLFTWSVTKRARLAALFAAMSTAVFGFQYLVLSLESFSLLVGAVALFLILSVIMAATRRLDWERVS